MYTHTLGLPSLLPSVRPTARDRFPEGHVQTRMSGASSLADASGIMVWGGGEGWRDSRVCTHVCCGHVYPRGMFSSLFLGRPPSPHPPTHTYTQRQGGPAERWRSDATNTEMSRSVTKNQQDPSLDSVSHAPPSAHSCATATACCCPTVAPHVRVENSF